MYSALAHRYASALFDLAVEAKKTAEYAEGLNSVIETFMDTKSSQEFISSPLIRAKEKEKVVKKALDGQGLPKNVESFVQLLAAKGRLPLLPEIRAAYQACVDNMNGVTRGEVRSATTLNPKQKTELEKMISSITGKKVQLKYKQEKALIGGLVAQVGSLTFDDSLSAHIQRIKEDLTRRIN